jgi:toxin-antitoxin system PIN domain toxin
VKIADVQILFYAIDRTSALHQPAARWLEDAINDREPLGLAWPTLHQFLRLGTNPAFPGCMSDDEALGWVEEWLEAGVQVIGDSDLRWDLFAELVGAARRSLRKAIDDAWLAALAISRGATLASFDDDFAPFVAHGLRWERPDTR